jgi:hypothetical protein
LAEEGHVSTAAVQLAMIAWETGAKLHWNGATGELTGPREAQHMLQRPYRTPWRRPTWAQTSLHRLPPLRQSDWWPGEERVRGSSSESQLSNSYGERSRSRRSCPLSPLVCDGRQRIQRLNGSHASKAAIKSPAVAPPSGTPGTTGGGGVTFPLRTK